MLLLVFSDVTFAFISENINYAGLKKCFRFLHCPLFFLTSSFLLRLVRDFHWIPAFTLPSSPLCSALPAASENRRAQVRKRRRLKGASRCGLGCAAGSFCFRVKLRCPFLPGPPSMLRGAPVYIRLPSSRPVQGLWHRTTRGARLGCGTHQAIHSALCFSALVSCGGSILTPL